MAQPVGDSERFLCEFHAHYPACTPNSLSAGFIEGRDPRVSSYDLVAQAVPASAKTVLDVGCGDGFLMTKLRAPDRRLIGVDLSTAELAACSTRLAGVADHTLHNARIQQMPLATSSVDASVSHLVLMLIPGVEEAMREIVRVLKPGGVFSFLVTIDHTSSDDLLSIIRAEFRAVAQQASLANVVNLADPRMRTVGGIQEVLAAVGGFNSVKVEPSTLVLDGNHAKVLHIMKNMYLARMLTAEGAELFWSKTDALLKQHTQPDGVIRYRLRVAHVTAVRE